MLLGSTKRATFSPRRSELRGLLTRVIPPRYGLSDRTANGSTFSDLRFLRVGDQRGAVFLDHVLVDDHLGYRLSGRVVHDVHQRALEDRAQAARTALLQGRHARDLDQRALAELELHAIHL